MRAKKKRNLIIMVVVLLALVATLVAVSIFGKDDNSETQEVKEALTSFNGLDISKVTYQYEDGKELCYQLVKEEWKNAKDSKFPLSTSAFENNFINVIDDLTISREVVDYEDISAFGLDTPYLTVTLENKAGNTETFYVGDYNSMLGQYYLQKKDSDKVYMIGTDLLYICRQDMYDYAQMESFPTYNTDTLTKLAIDNGTTEVEFVYFADGHETDLYGSCTWFFGKPFESYRSIETNKFNDMTEEVFDSLSFNKLVNYNASESDLEQYGLDVPKRSYTIHYTNSDLECASIVEFGDYNEETNCYYARMTEVSGTKTTVSDKVYAITKSTADTLLGLDPLDYVYKNVIYIKLSDVADGGNIEFNTPNGNYTLINATEYNEDGTYDKNEYLLNDKEAKEEDVEDLYYNILAKAGIERLIYDKSTIVKDKAPTYTITYNKTTDDYYGSQVVVTYTEYDLNYYQVAVNGVTDILVNKRLMDETMQMLYDVEVSE